jgi:hypothetical protein
VNTVPLPSITNFSGTTHTAHCERARNTTLPHSGHMRAWLRTCTAPTLTKGEGGGVTSAPPTMSESEGETTQCEQPGRSPSPWHRCSTRAGQHHHCEKGLTRINGAFNIASPHTAGKGNNPTLLKWGVGHQRRSLSPSLPPFPLHHTGTYRREACSEMTARRMRWYRCAARKPRTALCRTTAAWVERKNASRFRAMTHRRKHWPEQATPHNNSPMQSQVTQRIPLWGHPSPPPTRRRKKTEVTPAVRGGRGFTCAEGAHEHAQQFVDN